MKRGVGAVIGVVIAICLIGGAWLLVKGAHFDVLSPSGTIATEQRNLLIFALWLSALVVIPVYVMLGAFAWRYSEKNKKSKYNPDFTHSPLLEAIWWGIPIIIIGILSVVTWQTSHALDPYKKLASDQPTVNVQVVALEWKWLFIYPDYGVATVNQLVVPEKAPLHFSISSDAPMSGFWIPSLGSQIYAMNGMSSQLNLSADTTGNFAGYSTNINGQGYADMRFTVHSMKSSDFEQWKMKAKTSKKVMDESTYRNLAKPGLIKNELTYRLGNDSLYQIILDKYMSHGTQVPSKPIDDQSMNQTMNHDMPMMHHDMEGM